MTYLETKEPDQQLIHQQSLRRIRRGNNGVPNRSSPESLVCKSLALKPNPPSKRDGNFSMRFRGRNKTNMAGKEQCTSEAICGYKLEDGITQESQWGCWTEKETGNRRNI
ncbi:hypothetical protein VTL71DRAFT_7406, partial [Oculimacula yallundae]